MLEPVARESEERQMTKIDLGRIGAVLVPGSGDDFHAAVKAIEGLGVSTIWLSGGQLEGLWQLADVIRATEHVRVSSSVLSVDRFPVNQLSILYEELEHEHPGRFVVGLGGAHGAHPFETLTAYVDALAVPRERLAFAALGPRMLDFARTHGSGALPVLVTPEYTAFARSRLGTEATLAVDLMAVFDTDATSARTTARIPLQMLGSLPPYQASFKRQGFTDEDVETRSDRLVDALVPWGDADALAKRVTEYHDAGADHVAVRLITLEGVPVDAWQQLAPALGLG
jgi:probable F420-dependent oxidoreductase